MIFKPFNFKAIVKHQHKNKHKTLTFAWLPTRIVNGRVVWLSFLIRHTNITMSIKKYDYYLLDQILD